jgi:hypothetical protein
VDEATGMIAGPYSAHAAPRDGAGATAPESPPDASAEGRVAAPDAATDTGVAQDAQSVDGQSAAQTGQTAAREAPPASPGFRGRGRMRRRLAFLRRARELAYRDLGGLVFNLHRFGQRHDELVLAKLGVLERLDTELRGLESALAERRAATVLRVPGITACPRCAAIHASEDRFCPNCGLPMGRHPDLPIAAPTQATAHAAGSSATADHAAEHKAPAGPPQQSATPTTPSEPARPASAVEAAASPMDEPTEILRPPSNLR